MSRAPQEPCQRKELTTMLSLLTAAAKGQKQFENTCCSRETTSCPAASYWGRNKEWLLKVAHVTGSDHSAACFLGGRGPQGSTTQTDLKSQKIRSKAVIPYSQCIHHSTNVYWPTLTKRCVKWWVDGGNQDRPKPCPPRRALLGIIVHAKQVLPCDVRGLRDTAKELRAGKASFHKHVREGRGKSRERACESGLKGPIEPWLQ